MAEYIELEAAIRALQPTHAPAINEVLASVLRRVPAADVAPVRHGRWMWDGGEDMHYYCSLCHHNAYGNTGEILDGEYKYCPSCGATMDGGRDE